MAESVLLPVEGMVVVQINVSSASFHRVELSAMGLRQVWEGQGDHNGLLGARTLTAGVDIFSPVTVRIFTRLTVSEWQECPTVQAVQSHSGVAAVFVGADNPTGNRSFCDVIVSFSWVNYPVVADLLRRE